jgi:hypothetical protein
VIICPWTPAIKKYRKHQKQKRGGRRKILMEQISRIGAERVKKNGTARM